MVKVVFPARRGGFRVSFGSVPDYAFAGRGVRFEAIREGTPAAKAGVKAGDVLVRWGEKDIEDVEQWTALLGAHKPGDTVTIHLKRGEETTVLKVLLEARE
jgi:S1-C subfamily serine protease